MAAGPCKSAFADGVLSFVFFFADDDFFFGLFSPVDGFRFFLSVVGAASAAPVTAGAAGTRVRTANIDWQNLRLHQAAALDWDVREVGRLARRAQRHFF